MSEEMKKEFIPYTEALALKELGFDEPCQLGWYLPHSEIAIKVGVEPNYWQLIPTHPLLNQIAAPLYQQAFRWFREKYNLICRVSVTSYGCTLDEQEFYCVITSKYGTASYEIFNTYEEAELECLKKLIEIVKSKS